MAPRPSMGVPAPRAMPPYKYATGVRNPNPQVVQPALQQVCGGGGGYEEASLNHLFVSV